MEDGDVEQGCRSGDAVQISDTTPRQLLFPIQVRVVNGFGGQRETVGRLVDVGQIEHELDVTHAQGVFGPVRPVAMPALSRLAFVPSHVTKADLGETDRIPHELLDRIQHARMPYELVELR